MSLAFSYSNNSDFTDLDRGLLSGVLRRFRDATGENGGAFPTVIDFDSARDLIKSSGAPKDHAEMVDRLLEAAAKVEPRYGYPTPPETAAVWTARLFTLDVELVRAVIQDYQELWLYEFGTAHTPRGDVSKWILRLKRAGWDRIRALRERRGDRDRIFVASWSNEMVAKIVESAALDASQALGLGLDIGNRLAPLGKVDDAILAAIRSARVVVADFTGLRGGVYFEAGFALGLGVPVLFTCSKSWNAALVDPVSHDAIPESAHTVTVKPWSECLHFDTRQYWHYLWSGADDLAKAVIDRVQGWGLAEGQ